MLRRIGKCSLRNKSTLSNNQFSRLPKNVPGLYVGEMEKDSCGVGMIAHLNKRASRKVVLQANEMLVRMAHRGAVGCDPCSGDGSGMLVALPHTFLQRVVKDCVPRLEKGLVLPQLGQYAMGNVFFGRDVEATEKSKEIVNGVLENMGYAVIGWRNVPTNNSFLGQTSLASEPVVEQVFVENTKKASSDDFEKDLLLARNVATKDAEKISKDFYICSLSNRTVTYKGQLTPAQLYDYYFKDLGADDFHSYVALVHSRFSTNTFPSWDRAQPNRIMCHNGEINTLRGNKNWMYSRSGAAHSKYFKQETTHMFPACSDNMSDSGNFDSVLEVLTKAGDKTLPEAMMSMIPEAWQNDHAMSAEKKAMYEYHSCTMEPWDGPAMMAFTDGNYIGATLDRNGLRPSRYYVTNDDHVILSSEIGVLTDLKDCDVKYKGRLEPGKMFLVDFEQNRIVSDAEVKDTVAKSRPFRAWVEENISTLSDLAPATSSLIPRAIRSRHLDTTNCRLNMFGYTTETMDLLLMPMMLTGKEPLGSMGNDASLAVISHHPKLPYEYFKQLFAQVTNPPIDPIREDLVMSLRCPVGPERNVLESTSEHAKRLIVDHPVLTLDEMDAIKSNSHPYWHSKTLDGTFSARSGSKALVEAIEELCEQATDAISLEGQPILVISDRFAGPGRYPIPSLLALGAVHQHLIRTKQRSKVALMVESGDAKEVHDFCTLVGFGADAVCPYVAYEALEKMNSDGFVAAAINSEGSREQTDVSNKELYSNYRNAIGKGILKVLSKMGISTLHSYKGAQVFEAVGLSEDIIEACFTGTTSRIKGTDFDALYTDISRFHEAGYPIHSKAIPLVRNPGNFHYRNGEEEHFNTPSSMVALQSAARSNSEVAYRKYTAISDAQCRKVTLRGLLKFKKSNSIPLDQVEPAKEIVKRFNTGAMSLGSISRETHEALAVAMNSIGGRSNTGEGGEDIARFTDNRRSAIKQVASGRFGVTINYLSNADQIQIKMAQGAKPGEGGELPGHKVSDYIGSMRHTTPGVGLISPPPHHDIYSIEDLAQLIHDLKRCNPKAEISTKLVSEVGVGVVAAGVAKAKSDHITISGHDGGTGASSWTGVKNGGLPWELGIAEAQQTLVLNDLRSRVRIQTDGQLKSGRDVVIAALLGAEEFGFATAPLIALGCIMMRKCHLNTCPVGIATQDEELRKKFKGQPEHVMNFFFLMAEEIREYMAELGFSTMDEMIGQADRMEIDQEALHYKSKGLDLSPLLMNASELAPEAGVRKLQEQDPDYSSSSSNQTLKNGLIVKPTLDRYLIENALPVLDGMQKNVIIEAEVNNENRTVGATLSHEVALRYGEDGLPEDSIHIKLFGHGGQSLGCGLAKGVSLELIGDSNDYVGKALSGGIISVYPERKLVSKDGFMPHDNVVVGNAVLYGGTSGSAFFAGKAGERFAVRNSGVTAVVEGVGDHGCEYMTGGRVVILGSTGRNFAAGMSGGIAYVLENANEFKQKCNMGMVELETVVDKVEKNYLKELIHQHQARTGSIQASKVLENWDKQSFVKVMPTDYKRVLMQESQLKEELVA